jgi:hypothetical protein
MSLVIKIKTGSTFKLNGALTDSNGDAVNLTGYSIDLDVITPLGVSLVNASVGPGITITNAAGGLWETAETDTTLWPLGLIEFDLKYTVGGFITHTDNGYLDVSKGISQ